MISNYTLVIVLTVCLVIMMLIHVGYVKRSKDRFFGINMAYMFSLFTTALNSINMQQIPTRQLPAGSGLEDQERLQAIATSLVTYLQCWHATLTYMLSASRAPLIKIEMSVSHMSTYLGEMDEHLAYAFQVSITANGELNSFPLVIDSQNVDKVAGKMLYHGKQLEQLVNDFMLNGKGLVVA